MKQKLILSLIVILSIFGTGLSCSGKKTNTNAENITLKFWKPFDSSDKWQEIISDYRAVKPNINIEYTEKNSENYEKDLLEAMAVDQAPDIYSIRNDWLNSYKIKIAPTEVSDVRGLQDTYANVMLSDFLVNNKLYAISQTIDVLALYYNKQILASAGIARPPSTWSELVEMVPKLTKISSNGSINQSAISLGTSNNINRSDDILTLLMLQSDVDFYDDTATSPKITSGPTDERREGPAARSLRFYTQFSNPSSRVYTWGPKQLYSTDAFTSGKLTFTLGYSYLMPIILSKNAFLDYGVSGIPQTSINTPKTNLASYWAETVWAGSKQVNEAWEFIKFASSYEENKKYVKATNQPSSRLDVLVEQQKDVNLGVFADNVFSATSVAKPESASFGKILNSLIDDVSLVGISPNEAVQRASNQLKTLLEKYPFK